MIILEAHDEELAGDVLTNIALNYKWRQHIHEALCRYFLPLIGFDFGDDDTYTTWQNFATLLEDLYTTLEVDVAKVRLRRQTDFALAAGVEAFVDFDTFVANSEHEWETLPAVLEHDGTNGIVNVSSQNVYVHATGTLQISSAALGLKYAALHHNILGYVAYNFDNTSSLQCNLIVAQDVLLKPTEKLRIAAFTASVGRVESSPQQPYFSAHII